ncbi:C-type lectin protein [Phellopilus nigrolimitatus]|nr:C-type lectin protein [Phellopilus nigrolimitatus]
MSSALSSRSSSGSDSPSPSSQFSELSRLESAATSHAGDALRHFLAVSPPCETMPALDSFLRTVPLCGKEYLFLAMCHGDLSAVSRVESTPLGKAVCAMSSVLGDGSMFKSWSKECPDSQYYTSTTQDEAALEDIETQAKSTKISHTDALNVFASVGLHLVHSLPFASTGSANSEPCAGSLYLLERAPFSFSSLTPISPSAGAVNPFGPPTREEWRTLWAAWDLVTLGMIPPEMLHQKPIDLRHKCLFYIGHIPTFNDILLSHLFNEPYTEPKNFTQIFERGIDPHVDDPDHCHSHSDIPEADEDWPTLESILAFRDRVRARMMKVYDEIDSGKRTINRRIARVLQMTLEHEGFHVETLLYMLIQRAGTGVLPPPGFSVPPWTELAAQWAHVPAPASPSLVLGPASLTMGHDDSEQDDLAPALTNDVYTHEFGWDNESPRREVQVACFRVDWRPITNGEFLAFLKAQRDAVGLPASWTEENGQIFVRTVYGPISLSIAEHWPVLASYDQLQAYARSKGGRIPTEPELRLFLDKYEVGFDHGANVGFRNWHPVPATSGCDNESGGAGSNGGVWEWTSTAFDGHPGLAPTSVFPGYSSDFFDGKHHVVLGASYATIPRLAGRRTVRNFYQHNYPYAWVSARVAYDI